MDNNTLDAILRNASNPTGGVSQQKQTAVAETAAAKKAAMAPSFSADQLYPMVVGNQNGTGVASATQAELDARTMTPMAMWEKFGYTPETNTLLGNRAEATNQIVNDQTVGRDWNQTAADAVSAIGLGAANSIGGIGALGAGVVSTDAGNAIAQSLDTLNKDVMDNQSPALQARRRLNQAANLNDQRDSAQQLQEDIAAGGSKSWSGIKRIGRDAISSIGNASADPITLLDGTAQGVGSLVLTGPVGRATGAVNTSAILAARNAGVLSKDTARMLATAADKGGIAVLIGAMESGGSFQQTANQVLGMDFAKLEQNSPDFRKLIAAGTTPEDARAVLANKAGLEAAAITAPAAVAMGKFVAKFEAAPMSTAGLKSSLAAIGAQVMEEGGQGGVSQGAGNLAVARNADETQDLTAGVGEQIGTGALYGGLMTGGMHAPALAARGARAAVGATLNAVGNIGAAEPAPASAPTTIGVVTDSAKNAEQAASLVPAGEAVMASVMGNDTLDEPTKQAQVAGLQTLQSNFVYSPEDYAAARSVDAALPEALGERLSQVNNLPQAIHEVGTHVMGIANNPTPESIGEFVASVGYLDALLERVDSLAGLPEVNAVLAGITPGSAEEGYIQSIIQAQDNAANSQMVSKARNVIAAKLAKAAPMAQLTLETAGEALVRAKYAPQTMSQQVIDDTLAMAAAGQIQITPMQRIRLQAADALVRAMAAGETTDAADTVTRQIAFNDTKEGGQSYPSLVEHTNSITNAVVKGNTKLGKDQMVQLRNFAVTMANKMTAINNYIADNSIGRQKYQNWIPTENKWRESAMGLDVNMSSKKSQNFGKRIHTEAMLAAATYNNLLEMFPDLAATTSVPLPMPTMNKSLASALTRNSTPKTAAAPAPAVPAAVTEPTKVITPAAPVEESTIAPANQAPALTEQATAATPSTTFTRILNEDYVGLDKPADVLEFAKEAKAELAALKKVDEPTADQQKVADRLDNMFKEDTSFDWDTFMSEADGATPADFNALSEITGKEPASPAAGVPAEGAGAVEAAGVEQQGPGADAGNGFKQGPEKGERYRVGVSVGTGGVMLEKRLPAGTAATFYVGKDGGLVDADAVNLVGTKDREKLWIPTTPEQASQATAILDEMGRLDLTDPKRKDAKARLKALVTAPAVETTVPVSEPKVEETQTEPAVPATKTVADKPAAVADETAQASALGRLIGGLNGKANELVSLFTFKGKNRTQTMADPYYDVVDALASEAAYKAATGVAMPEEKIKAAKLFMEGLIGPVVSMVDAQLQGTVNVAVGKHTATIGEAILQATVDASGIASPTALTAKNRGAFTALLEQTEQGLQYSQHLLHAAGTAVGHWFTAAGGAGSHKMAESQVASYVGISADKVTPQLQRLVSMGISDMDAIRGLADKIQAMWGATVNNDAPLARAQSIPLGMAANYFHAMVHGMDKTSKNFSDAFFTVKEIVVDKASGNVLASYDLNGDNKAKKLPKFPEGDIKKLRRYIPHSLPTELQGIGPVLTKLTDIPTDETTYFDAAEVAVSDTQLRSNVPLSKDEKSAQAAQQKVGHKINAPFLKLLRKLTVENMVALMGADTFDGMNVKARESAEGKNMSVMGGYSQAHATVARIETEAAVRGVDALDLPVHYKYETTSTGRSMMQGKYSPQSDKTVRNLIMPQEAAVDLTDPAQRLLWDTASIQMIGERTYAMLDAEVTARAAEIFGHPDVVALQDLLADLLQDKDVDSSTLVQAFKTAVAANEGTLIADGMTNEFMHVMLDRARLAIAKDGGKDFTSKLYLEADGVANGPAGAMAMLSVAAQDGLLAYVKKMRKAGLFIGLQGQYMGLHRQVDKVDAYAETGANTVNAVWKNWAIRYPEGGMNPQLQALQNQHAAVMDFVSKVYPGGAISLEPDADGYTVLTIKRSATKNPMTVTVYGSGADGIASKISGILVDELAQTINTALKTGDFAKVAEMRAAWGRLTHSKVVSKGAKMKIVGKAVPNEFMHKDKLPEFQLNAEQFDNLKANIHEFLVQDMARGIEETVGKSTMMASQAMVAATSVQAVVLQHAFKNAVDALVKSKKDADSSWRYDLDGFTKNDLKALDKELMFLRPILRSMNQVWDVSGSQRSFGDTDVATDMFGRYSLPMTMFTPGVAGVKVAPYLVIGMGDALMVQNLFNEWSGGGILQVFDGINLGLNDIKTGGEVVNKAMSDAWLNSNPMQVVAESFRTTVELGDIEAAIAALPEDQQTKVITSLYETWGGPENLLLWLQNQAKEVDIQHAAIREVGFSADQMAATGSPNVESGTSTTGIYLDAESAEQSAQEIADQMAAVIARLQNANKVRDEKLDVLIEGAPKDKHGNTVITLRGIMGLLRHIKMDDALRSLALEALATNSEALKDMKVVVGSTETLLAGGYDFGHATTRAGLVSQNIRGLWDEATKTLVLAPGHDGSTLAHELIHAATLSALTNAYLNELPMQGGQLTKWGQAVRDSALELERMMLQFVTDHPVQIPHISGIAYKQVAGVVSEIRKVAGVPEGTTIADGWFQASPQGRIHALNEFMAHVLTNSKLREITRLQKFKTAMKAVFGFIRAAIFGERAALQPRARGDMLSQLEFHTRVLMNAREQLGKQGIREMMANPTVLESRILGDDHAQMVAKAFNDTVGSYITARSDKLTQVLRKAEYQQGVLMAADMVNTASAVGFLGSPVQRTAFLQMAAAMATQAEISPAVMQEAQALYRETAKNINTGLGLSQDQVDLVLGRAGIEEDAQGRSSLVPMFFALGTVDPTFREALTKISAPNVKQEGGDTLDTKLQALGNNVLAKIQQSMVGTAGAPNVTAALNALAETVIDHARKEENLLQQMDTRAMGMVNKGNEWVVARMESASKSIAAKAQRVSAGTKSKTVKTTAQVVGLTANIFNEEGAKANAEAMLAMANRGMSGVVRSVVKDLTGRVDSNAQVYDLIKSASQQVSKIRQFFKEDLPSVLSAGFKAAPTPEQWSHLFKSMAKVDIASLVQGNDLNAALNLAVDKSARTAEIARLEAALKLADPKTFGRVMKKSHQLAAYLTTGVAGSALLRNADAVANLLNDKVSGMTAPGVAPKPASYVAMVDQLITLYALEVQPKDVMNTFEDMRKSEPEGMQQLLGVMLAQRTKDTQRHTGNARFNAIKGYIPSDGTAGASMIVADTRDDDNLRQKGYTKVADYKGTPLFKTSTLAYYFTPVGKAPFNQGIIQNARMTAGGVDQSTGFAVGIPTAGRIVQKTTVDRLARNMHLDTGREALMPLFNEAGQIYAFERSIDPDQLERLQPSTHLAAMLGQWMGRQAEEELAQGVNFDAVAKVHDMWKNAGSRASEFVNVLDPNAFKDDPVTQDALRLIPADVKAQAEQLFGTGKLMVRKDMIDDVFGYRDASLGDAWTGNSRWSPKTQDRVRKLAEKFLGADAFRIVSQREQQWRNLVKDAKTLIVVKSMVVPAANFVANIFQLMARGVPLSTIAKGLRNKTLEIDQYVKSHVEKMELQVKLMAAGGNTTARQKYEAQIQAIDDSWKRLSIWPLIEAGEFGSISDAGISRDEILLSEGKLQAYLEAKTDKLPPGIRSMGKNMLITKDTALFQGLQKSMEYGDFLAKAILFDQKTGQGMSKVDALGEITDEFVNYDRLPGRFRGSLENLGLLWFYNYKLRIAKVAFSMLRRDPLRVLLLSGSTIPGMALPLSENIFTKGIEGTLGYSIGPGMLFSAPGLNPWAAALQ